MRHLPLILAALLLAGTALAQTWPGTDALPAANPAQLARSPAFKPGGWTTIDCSNSAAAASAAITAGHQVVLMCQDDSYVAWGVSGVTADSGDGVLYEGAWLRYLVTPATTHVSCLNVNEDSSCKYIEVQ